MNFLKILIIVLVSLLLTIPVRAADTAILNITEVMPNPAGSDTTGEWIELSYTGTTQVSLDNWEINGMTLPDLLVNPGEIVVLARDTATVRQFVSAEVAVIPFSFSLNNLGASLTLSSQGSIIQDFTYSRSTEGDSFELLAGNCREIRSTPRDTIGTVNTDCDMAESPDDDRQAASLYIMRAMPAPVNGPEWFEIKNYGGKTTDLLGFSVKDASGKQASLEGTIQSGGTIKVSSPDISLNNSGDILYLIAGSGMVIDVFAYESAPKGQIVPLTEITSRSEQKQAEVTVPKQKPATELPQEKPAIYGKLGLYLLSK